MTVVSQLRRNPTMWHWWPCGQVGLWHMLEALRISCEGTVAPLRVAGLASL